MTVSDLLKKLNLPEYAAEIGVLTPTSKRDKKGDQLKGINNAQLLFIMEHGSPKKNIPKRPVLDYTIQWAKTQLPSVLARALAAYCNSGFKVEAYEKELKKFCARMESYARDLIYKNDGTFVDNAPSTIRKKKGTNHPLFDTGQMARSITCRLVKL